jgi:hypothetical protein
MNSSRMNNKVGKLGCRYLKGLNKVLVIHIFDGISVYIVYYSTVRLRGRKRSMVG